MKTNSSLPIKYCLIAALCVWCNSIFADSFEFGGLSRATTLQEVIKRYPNSLVSGSYVHVSPKDTHDHIFGIELYGPNLSYRLRINFGSPEHEYPSCENIEKIIVKRHGKPTKIKVFNEEAVRNRYLIWQTELEVITLQCFLRDNKVGYLAEAIAVHPIEQKGKESNSALK